ncbi:hypothetical protein F2Q69_00041726 [Brassica cretica]|uniref:Uncharacterized protein n=1 Tax=Brassica cretica TaxID=69181 RepID=A0A8S9NSZ8_BRACR|nr:hypothetical protein F2Q69_00041726 [Brassica cretica]
MNNTTSIDNYPIPKTTVSEKDKFDNQYLTPDEFGILKDPSGYAKAIDGRTLHVSLEDIADILQTANGADNLFMHQRSNREQKTTKEFYDTAGGIENSFKQRSHHTTHPSINIDVPTVARQQEFGKRAYDLYGNMKFYWEEKDEYEVYRDDREYARDLDGHTIPVHLKDIRRLLERASRDEPACRCLPEHASSYTQTQLVPEIYTKDEINEMFYGVCGEHERNKEAFQMKLDGVYGPLNDSISWLTTCMEEMKKDIARIQNATNTVRPPLIDRRHPQSIDNRQSPSLARRHHASIDTNPPHPHTKKSQPNFHTREELDQLVEGIYRALETTEERLDGRCDDIYFPMDLTIGALTSKAEAIQGELVEIQSYIACRPEKQQGNPAAILTRSCKFGSFNPQRSALLINRQQHLFVARFRSTTVNPDTSPVDRYSLTTVDRRHSSSIDRNRPSDIDRHRPSDIDRTPAWTSTDTEPRDMVATLILVRDERGDLHDQEGLLRNAAEPVIDLSPAQRQRNRSQKGKGVASENVLGNLPLPEWNPSFSLGEGSGNSEVSLPSDFFADLPSGFTTHKSLDEESRRKVVAEGSSLINEGMRVFNAALDGIFRESRISHFKAEEAERELFRFRKEVEEQGRRQAEIHSRVLVRAERRGKRAIVAEMKRRVALFATEFESFKDAQEFVGDFRECRGSVATLYKSQNEDFSFLAEVAEMSGLMNGCAHAESLVPPIEGRIRQLWDSFEVSEDTAEAGTGVGDEGAGVADGEVDQPASSFGISMSGFLDFEL